MASPQTKQDDAEIYDEITIKWHKKTPDIRIVVSGLVGAGKSTLVNSLSNTDKCEIGESDSSYTKRVNEVSCRIGGTKLQICDTPGFMSTDEDIQRRVKDSIYRYFKSEKHCNIFVYAMRMSNTRFERNFPDVKVQCALTRRYGNELWKNSIIVLTYANLCIATHEECGPSECDMQKWFSERVQEWTTKIRTFMEEFLDKEVVKNIPIVVAGLPTETRLSTEPKGTSWINNIWLSILSSVKNSMYSQPLIINILLQKIFMEPGTSGDTIKKFLLNHHLCYVEKASKLTNFHDPKRKRIIGIACSVLSIQKYMLSHHLAMQSQEDCDVVLQYWKNISISVEVFVTGSIGSGKTSIVNSLFYWPKEEVKEGHSIEPSKEMNEKCIVLDDFDGHCKLACRIWDTPDFDDPTNLAIIKPVFSKIEIGLLFFCIAITDTESNIKKNICEFTNEFGEEVWDNAVIVLTFANTITRDNYSSKIEARVDFIMGVFQTISNDLGEKIVIVPAGYHTNIQVAGDPDNYWLVDLWIKAISKTKTQYQPIMIATFNYIVSRSKIKELAFYQHYKHQLIDLLYSISLQNNLIDTNCALLNF